jgi:ribosome biogenesis ATPase
MPILHTAGDVGALAEVREELLHNVLEPIAHPERFRALGLEVPAGVLFFGPPGLVTDSPDLSGTCFSR